MKFTPSQVIEMAREAGFLVENSAAVQAADRLCTIAADRALEAAAKVCDTTPPKPFCPSIQAAHAIRAMKERQ